MCGIVGFNWQDKDKITALSRLLAHRGPQQEGFHVADGVSLGHQRLCIIDLSEKARQPLYNEDGSVCVCFNGEIFNFMPLRDELLAKGHVFISRSDTEVLVHGYEEWGYELLSKINGQFSFCIFDRARNQFFLARDRLGIKPLYYYHADQQFIFGSELKVFLQGDIKKKVNRQALNHYLLFGNAPTEHCLLAGVRQVLPGSFLVYDLGQNKITRNQRYWNISFSETIDKPEDQIAGRLRLLLEECVHRQLIADVPLGAFLSGGVDSSIIVALMRKHVKELKTFSIRFDYPEFNESAYAKIVAEKFNTRHFEIAFDAKDVLELIPRLVYHYDEPFGDPSMIPTFLVSSVARRQVTVSLSGTGGDELFGGYPRYRQFSLLKRLNHLPGVLRRLLEGSVGLANLAARNDKLSKLRTFLGKPQADYIIYLMLFSYMFRSKDEPAGDLSGFTDLEKYFSYSDDLTNLLNFDLHEYLPNCLLTKEDRASMAVSLEARVPFLDHELVEFAATLAPDWKIRHGQKKYILKKAFADVLPREILYRRKQGFGVPLVHYFRRELKEFARREIFEFREYDYYDKSYLQALWQRHQDRRADYSRIFWTIIMFNLWYKKWMR